MKCLTYARVSTDKQAEKELSIPAQLSAMRQYAESRNWQIAGEFLEPGASARTTERPVLKQLLARCREQHDKVDVVLVHKIDRLARNVADHAMIQTLLRRWKVRLVSVVENLDDTVSGHLVEHIMAAIAEFHSSNLSEETKKGMRQKVLQGGWPHLPPRGYLVRREEGKSNVAIDPIEGPLVTEAFDLYATGFYSEKRVARHLAAQGLRAKNGAPLSASRLTRMFENPFYAGQLEWNEMRVPGKHPALVSQEVFERVRRVRELRRTQRHIRETVAGYPLRVIATCSCGGRMTIDRKARHQYYRCSRQAYRPELCRAQYCSAVRAHQRLETICRTILTDGGQSLWDSYAILRPEEQRLFLEQVFSVMVLGPEGITRFELRPLWIRAVLARQRFLAA